MKEGGYGRQRKGCREERMKEGRGMGKKKGKIMGEKGKGEGGR